MPQIYMVSLKQGTWVIIPSGFVVEECVLERKRPVELEIPAIYMRQRRGLENGRVLTDEAVA